VDCVILAGGGGVPRVRQWESRLLRICQDLDEVACVPFPFPSNRREVIIISSFLVVAAVREDPPPPLPLPTLLPRSMPVRR
jgi:hypothetical protein